jgi:hypothetical protein
MVGSVGIEAAEGCVAVLAEAVDAPLDLRAEGLGVYADDEEEALALFIADFGLPPGREGRGGGEPAYRLGLALLG